MLGTPNDESWSKAMQILDTLLQDEEEQKRKLIPIPISTPTPSSSTPMPSSLSDRWNSYAVEKGVIGHGDYCVVRRATDIGSKVGVAMKIFNSSARQEQVENEVKLLKLCQPSRYVVAYLDHFQHDFDGEEKWVLVLELCSMNLNDYIQNRFKSGESFTEAEIWKLFLCAAAGLWVAHFNHVIHRDMKPENYLVTSDGNVKLSDMGLSKQQPTSATIIQSQAGNLLYRSPEKFHTDFENRYTYGLSSDIWALGCILYLMCTGVHPFNADGQASYNPKLLGQRIYAGRVDYSLFATHLNVFRNIIQSCLNNRDGRPDIHELLVNVIGRERLCAFDSSLMRSVFAVYENSSFIRSVILFQPTESGSSSNSGSESGSGRSTGSKRGIHHEHPLELQKRQRLEGVLQKIRDQYLLAQNSSRQFQQQNQDEKKGLQVQLQTFFKFQELFSQNYTKSNVLDGGTQAVPEERKEGSLVATPNANGSSSSSNLTSSKVAESLM